MLIDSLFLCRWNDILKQVLSGFRELIDLDTDVAGRKIAQLTRRLDWVVEIFAKLVPKYK